MSETERRPHKAEREAREDRLQARAAGLAPKPLPIATLNMEVWARNDFEEKAVEDYAEAMGAGESFPAGRRLPRRGDQLAGRRSPQGRCRAPRRTYGDPGRGALGRPTRRSAVAIWANARDGVSLTRADRRRAVEGLLRDEEWREWSDRQIARHCGVDHKTVGARPCAAPGQWGNSPSGGRWRRASARRPAGTGRSFTPARPADSLSHFSSCFARITFLAAALDRCGWSRPRAHVRPRSGPSASIPGPSCFETLTRVATWWRHAASGGLCALGVTP
jgi:hypothetical protein